MLAKQKLRGPWRITFDTNPDQCNLHCIMCEEHSKFNQHKSTKNRIMDFNIIQKVITDSIEYGLREVIPSTMGEPLLYNRFLDFMNLIKEHGLKLNLTTNGTFPKLGVEKWASLILPIVSDIKVSINGAYRITNESIMEGLNHEHQIKNLEYLIQARDDIIEKGLNHPTITLQVTFMEHNYKELPNLLEKAIELNVDRFKGHHVWITHPQIEKESLKRNSKTIRKWNIMVQKLKEVAEQKQLSDGGRIRLANVYPINFRSAQNGPDKYECPFLGKEAWIAWNGKFNVCCAPDNLRRSLGDFGNVQESSFMDLWNSQGYKQLNDNWGNYEVCSICNMRKPLTNREKCLK